MVHHVGGVVQDVARHQHDHGGGEKDAEVKTDEDRDYNQTKGDQAADGQDWRQEGKVLARHEDRDRQTAKRGQGEDAGRGDYAIAELRCNDEQRQEDDGFGDDVEGEAAVLQGARGLRPRPILGKPGSPHKGSQDKQPTEARSAQQALNDIERNSVDEYGFQADEGQDGAGEMGIGASDKRSAFGRLRRRRDTVTDVVAHGKLPRVGTGATRGHGSPLSSL